MSVYACVFAFFIYFFKIFPALLLLSLYPSWLARKRWLTFPTPHNPVTVSPSCRLHLLFLLHPLLSSEQFEVPYLTSSFFLSRILLLQVFPTRWHFGCRYL